MDPLTTGRLARAAGVKIATVRFYERRGLLAAPARSEAGYREYTRDDAVRLVFIRRAQELGFSLAEIRDLLDLFTDPRTDCAAVKARASAKLADLAARLRDLRKVERALARLAGRCRGRGPATTCPIFQALEEPGPRAPRRPKP